MPVFTRPYKSALLVVFACLAAYAPSLRAPEFFHDDQAWIVNNPLLHQGLRALPKIFASGYVEPVLGKATTIQEYRPLLVLSFLAQTATTGFLAAPMRAANVLLHALVCLLFWTALRRRMTLEAATVAALIYAILPVHSEAVDMISWRSEILTAASILGAWLCLEDGWLAAGSALYCAGMLVKEHAILFPAFYALADWTFHGNRPWKRLRIYGALAACAAGYLALRSVVLTRMMHGGVAYFHSHLTAALTLSRFFVRHYLWTSVTGAGLCSDYSRPLIPDSSAASLLSWICLSALALTFIWAVRELIKRRSQWAFWLLGPCLFLLPTSHIIFPLDTIGADRFLYIPTLGLAAGFGWLFSTFHARRPAFAYTSVALIAAWYMVLTARRAEAWSTKVGFYEAAVACNPVSAKARNGLGEALIARGDETQARAQWSKAVELDPLLSDPYYNLGRLEWIGGRKQTAEAFTRRALELDPKSADAWVLLSLALQDKGETSEAEQDLNRAVEINPNNALAHFNLGRLLIGRGDAAGGAAHLARFLELAPDDPDAYSVRNLLRRINAAPH